MGDRTTSGFAKLGGGVITQTVAGTKTAGNNPNCVRLRPQLRKAASPLAASDRSVAYNDVKMLKLDININYLERDKKYKDFDTLQ